MIVFEDNKNFAVVPSYVCVSCLPQVPIQP